LEEFPEQPAVALQEKSLREPGFSHNKGKGYIFLFTVTVLKTLPLFGPPFLVSFGAEFAFTALFNNGIRISHIGPFGKHFQKVLELFGEGVLLTGGVITARWSIYSGFFGGNKKAPGRGPWSRGIQASRFGQI